MSFVGSHMDVVPANPEDWTVSYHYLKCNIQPCLRPSRELVALLCRWIPLSLPGTPRMPMFSMAGVLPTAWGK